MGLSVPIGSQNKLVLKLKNLDCSPQIPSLKLGLKHKCSVCFRGGKVEGQDVYSKGLGIESSCGGWLLLIIDYFVEQSVHENDDLYVLFDGLFEDVQLGLIDRIGLLVLTLDELRVARQEGIVNSTEYKLMYVLTGISLRLQLR